MPIEELVSSLQGVADVRGGLESISSSARSTSDAVASAQSLVGGLNSTLSAVTATLIATDELTGAVGEQNTRLLRDLTQTVGFVQNAVAGLELLPAGIGQRIGGFLGGAARAVSAPTGGVAGAPVSAVAAGVGGAVSFVALQGFVVALVKAQVDEFEKRFSSNEKKFDRLDAALKRVDAVQKAREKEERERKDREAKDYTDLRRRWRQYSASPDPNPQAAAGSATPVDVIGTITLDLQRKATKAAEARRAHLGAGN